VKAYPCPVCRRAGWITRDGVEQHLANDHGTAVLAAELVLRVYPPEPAASARPACPKVPYQSEDEALRALLSTWRSRDPRRKEQRAYCCHVCQLWHLTSQPERTTA
jgi:hypothetical protein